MANKSASDIAQKHLAQKGKSPAVADISLRNNLSFREAAKKLAKMSQLSSMSTNLAYDTLLRELRAGELCAGFCLSDVPWVSIPTRFWLNVKLDRMKKLLSKKSGTLNFSSLEVMPFMGDVLNSLSKEQLIPAICCLLSNTKNGFQFEIPYKSWSDFCEKNNLNDVPAHSGPKGKQGKPQSSHWREVAQFLLGYCLAQTPDSKTEQNSLKIDLRIAAEKLGLTEGWPGDSSFRDTVSQGFKIAKRIEESG